MSHENANKNLKNTNLKIHSLLDLFLRFVSYLSWLTRALGLPKPDYQDHQEGNFKYWTLISAIWIHLSREEPRNVYVFKDTCVILILRHVEEILY